MTTRSASTEGRLLLAANSELNYSRRRALQHFFDGPVGEIDKFCARPSERMASPVVSPSFPSGSFR
jgi:hypothetical protein